MATAQNMVFTATRAMRSNASELMKASPMGDGVFKTNHIVLRPSLKNLSYSSTISMPRSSMHAQSTKDSESEQKKKIFKVNKGKLMLNR